MQHLAIVNPGLEELAQQEIKELINEKAEIDKGILKFSADKKQLSQILQKNQSFYKLLAYLGEYKNLDEIDFSKLNLKDFLNNNITLKIEVENVKGQENRQEISKKIGSKLFPFLKESKINAEINFKTPDLILIIYHTGEKYFLGVDLTKNEMNKRDYRVFAHSASFKGDFAYYFARKSGFKLGEKLIVGFCKDGVIAIEAALFANNDGEIYCFDEGISNVNSAKKNAALAKVKDFLKINKHSLDELDVKYSKNYFDRLIFHLTTKDEDKINEIYYQARYVLKKGGTILLIGRSNLDLSISSDFKLVEVAEIRRGDNIHKSWLISKG